MKFLTVALVTALASASFAASKKTTTSTVNSSSNSAATTAPMNTDQASDYRSPDTTTTTTTTPNGDTITTENTTPPTPAPAGAAPNAPPQQTNYNSSTYSSTTSVQEEDKTHEVSPGGLFLEPSIGYSKGDTDIEAGRVHGGTNDISGGVLGLRLGVHASQVVFLAADGRYQRANLDNTSYGNGDGDLWNAGVTLGVQAPIYGLRGWGTYVAAGGFTPPSSAIGESIRARDANGWRAGLGLHVRAFSINLEYEDISYKNTDVTGPIATATDINFGDKAYTLSLGFPIEL